MDRQRRASAVDGNRRVLGMIRFIDDGCIDAWEAFSRNDGFRREICDTLCCVFLNETTMYVGTIDLRNTRNQQYLFHAVGAYDALDLIADDSSRDLVFAKISPHMVAVSIDVLRTALVRCVSLPFTICHYSPVVPCEQACMVGGCSFKTGPLSELPSLDHHKTIVEAPDKSGQANLS